jgi:hypothetical protein
MAEKSKKKYTYGDKFQQRTKRVFEILLDCAFQEIELEPKETCTEKSWKGTPQFQFEVTKKGLIAVARRKRWKNGGGWEFDDEKNRRWASEIYPALSHYLGDEFLGILQGGGQQGSSEWSFTLRLWHSEKAENLKTFIDKWQEAHQARSKVAIPQAKKAEQGIIWRSACKARLERQKQQLTSSPLHLKARDLDSVHVPLGLVERKERPKVDHTQEISPDGSASEQPEYTEKRVEHKAFLAVVSQRKPGAGKTTLLTKVWEELLKPSGEDIIVAWVPLAAVKNNELEDYLHKSWIKQFCKSGEIDRYWASFEALADAGRVWLLLDGADEMGGEALSKLETTLQKEKWARLTRAIITCRLNLWDASSTNKLQTSSNFQMYRTLDFKYANPAGEDEVKLFIDNWFQSSEKPEAGQKLRAALNEVGKERIKDLAKNPLRLTLLCDIWEERGVLPDTQADLYEKFVKRFYKWSKFPELLKRRERLNQLMQSLAKYGLNKPSQCFQFTEAELQEQLIEAENLDALKALGWLVFVGVDESDDEVYAFFHPTFQEYFAACSIDDDDWDYFLPRAHVDRPVSCQGEPMPTYRVFQKQWQQVIIFWIGRNFDDKLKNEFLVKLTNFCDGTSEFYYYQAYCLAAICVGEFQSSQHAESIVQTVVNWTFGYFDPDVQKWVNLERVNRTFILSILPLSQRKYLIVSILSHIFQNDLPYEATLHMDSIQNRLLAISVLGKIAKGNKRAIENLTSFIYKTDSYLLSITAAEALGTIDNGSHLAITIMIDFLCKPGSNEYNMLFFVTQCLARISIGNECVIQELLNILSQLRDTDDCRQSMIVYTLSTIAVGHIETIAVLISILQSSPDFPLSSDIADALVKIASNNEDAIEIINSNFFGTTRNKDLEPYISRGLREINSSNQKEAISLHNLLLDSNIYFFHAKEVLRTLEVGDKQAKRELSAIILELDINNPKLLLAAYILGRIDVGNKLAITTLLTIISQSNLDDCSLFELLHCLQEIALGNREVIETLMDFLSKPNLSNILRHSVAYTLWNIDIGNNKAITTLIDLISHSEWDDSLPLGTGEDLNEIITIDLMPMIVSKLKYQAQTDMCKSNDKKFYICKTVMWKCAQSLSYHEFYSAWHQN